jgi:hypothetical protein
MDYGLIKVFDDVLTETEHKNIFQHLKRNVEWTNRWSSTTKRPDGKFKESWHWNCNFTMVPTGMPSISEQDMETLSTNHPAIVPLWNVATNKINEVYGKCDILRMYSNCNPFGTNAYVHHDDGDFTAVYYPALEWEPEWEGGTCLYTDRGDMDYDAHTYVSYRPNRMVVFPAKIPHRGMPVDRSCYVPRYVIAMKLQIDVNHISYMDMYNRG